MEEFGIEFTAMASRGEVRLMAPDETTARHWAQAAIDEVRRIETKFSRYQNDSIITRINRAAGGAAVEVDEETAALLDFGARLFADSEGLFDLTSGVLRQAWNFRQPRVPTQVEINALLPLIGWDQVEWLRPRVRLPRTGMEIDFGGIGKEYAADRAATMLANAGARHGYINLGGDMRGVGARPNGEPWAIAVQHPRKADCVVGALAVAVNAVATSGDYERFFEHDGRRYCHIMNPRNGRPDVYWQTVSVVAPLCIAAGACATIAMLMSRDNAVKFLAAQRVSWLAVSNAGEVLRG